jgi:hypothetical protein
MWKEMGATYSKAPSWHSSGGTEGFMFIVGYLTTLSVSGLYGIGSCDDKLIGKDLEGSGNGLIEFPPQHLPEGTG